MEARPIPSTLNCSLTVQNMLGVSAKQVQSQNTHFLKVAFDI